MSGVLRHVLQEKEERPADTRGRRVVMQPSIVSAHDASRAIRERRAWYATPLRRWLEETATTAVMLLALVAQAASVLLCKKLAEFWPGTLKDIGNDEMAFINDM